MTMTAEAVSPKIVKMFLGESSRYALGNVFKQGDSFYATDGRVAIRVDHYDDDFKDSNDPECNMRFPEMDKFRWFDNDPCELAPWPERNWLVGEIKNPLGNTLACHKCKGRGTFGKTHKVCRHCDGVGCKRCKLRGYQGRVCGECGGFGKKVQYVGMHMIAARYDYLVRQLPFAMHVTEINGGDPLVVKFDGGTALIMGLSKN